MHWLAHQNGEDKFEAHRYPLVCFNFLSQVSIKISDPVIVQELYTTYNNLTDKRGQARDLLSPMLGDSILFSKNDEIWKTRRKAISHAFYKDKISHMLEVFKDTVGAEFEKLSKEID